MAQEVRQAILNPLLRESALNLLSSVSAIGIGEYARAVRNYMRSHIVLVNEMPEVIQSVSKMLNDIENNGIAYGDCDDSAILTAAHLFVIGINTRFKAINPNSDGSFSHVFTEYQLPRSNYWLSIDTTIDYTPVYEGSFLTVEI